MARENALRYSPSVGPQRIHMSLCFTVITIDANVVFGPKQSESCYMYVYSEYCKIVSKCASQGSYEQQRNLNGIMG